MNEEFLKQLSGCWSHIKPNGNKCCLMVKDTGTYDGKEYELQVLFKMKKKKQYNFLFKILDKFPSFITHIFKLHNNEGYWKYLLKNPKYRYSIINYAKNHFKKIK